MAVTDLASLKQGMEAIFALHGPHAIAVKAQHAYNRTLRWEERADADAERVLQRLLQGAELDEPSRLLLGDWCWARGTELAIEYELPFKIHTGYYAGNDRMPVDRIKSGNLCPLLARYLDCRFVLMHIAYPYSNRAGMPTDARGVPALFYLHTPQVLNRSELRCRGVAFGT